MSASIHSSTSTTITGGSASVILTKPSGVKNGDLLIAVVASFLSTSQSVTPPAGWTLIQSVTVSTVDILSVYSKIASSEPASWTWTIGASTGKSGGAVFAVIDYDVTTPIDAVAAATAGTTQTPSYANTITPTRAASLLLMFTGAGSGGLNVLGISGYAITTNNPSWTELYQLDYNDSSSTCALGIAMAIRTAITATGNSSTVIAGPGNPYGSSNIILSIKRTTNYTVTVVDTQIISDNASIIRTRVLNGVDTQITTDAATADNEKTWKTTPKNTDTWINTKKS